MNDELLFVTDENDVPLTPLPRKLVIERGLWRRTGGMMVINIARTKVLCQKRSVTKDERPGVWIAMVGGKSAPGETSEQTTLRELREEFGIQAEASELTFYKKVKSDTRRQFEYLYWFFWDGDESEIKPDPDEVSQVAWYEVSEAIKLLKNDSNWYAYGYDLEMLELLSAAQ